MMHTLAVARYLVGAAVVLTVVNLSPPIDAQMHHRVTVPGTAFTQERVGKRLAIQDTGATRHFRGGAFQEMRVTAEIPLPAPTVARPTMVGLVIRFRTSPQGPSLRGIELLHGSSAVLNIQTHLSGDYTTR